MTLAVVAALGWLTFAFASQPDVQHLYRRPEPAAFLAATAGLMIGMLATPLATSLGWLAILPASLIPVIAITDNVPFAIAFGLALVPVSVGALEACEPARRLHPRTPALATAVVLAVAGAWAVAWGFRFDTLVVPRDVAVAAAVGLTLVGLVRPVRDAFWRARGRLGRTDPDPVGDSALLAATLDELVPGRARSRLQAIERERAALAADLHADVLPDLAAIIRSVDAGLDSAASAARLRNVVGELRELMSARRLTVLDELGLVPALEWLAGRVHERTNVAIEIEVHGDDVDRPRRDVELAAWRVAQQAIDNALVHGRPTQIGVILTIAGDRLVLEVSDNGTGIPPDAEPRALRAGRLGLADMRARAAAIGGAFEVWRRPEGGTTAELRWPT